MNNKDNEKELTIDQLRQVSQGLLDNITDAEKMRRVRDFLLYITVKK